MTPPFLVILQYLQASKGSSRANLEYVAHLLCAAAKLLRIKYYLVVNKKYAELCTKMSIFIDVIV